MEYVNAALIIIGFIIIGYYQREKIGALEKQISSQKEILGSAKTFIDLFDLGKLKGYGEVIERKIRTEMESEITQMRNKYTEEEKKQKDSFSTFVKDFVVKEFLSITKAFIMSLIYVPRDKRKPVFDKLDEGVIKQALGDLVATINKEEEAVRGAAIAALLREAPKNQ